MGQEHWGKPPEETVELYDTIEMVNGVPGCADCGSLLCVQTRPRPNPITGTIGEKMLPEPVPPIENILCAGCGAILWEADTE